MGIPVVKTRCAPIVVLIDTFRVIQALCNDCFLSVQRALQYGRTTTLDTGSCYLTIILGKIVTPTIEAWLAGLKPTGRTATYVVLAHIAN